MATIKFYLRERLLPPGAPTARNQADYDCQHLKRLRLIRAFTGVGQLDLSSVRDLLAAIDDAGSPLPELYSAVNRTLFTEAPAAAGPAADPAAVVPAADPGGVGQARADVDEFIADLGWQVEPESPGRGSFAQVLAALRRLGCEADTSFFAPYADAAEQLAAWELDLLPDDEVDADRAAAVARTVLFEVALAALRRMAQEHYLTHRFGPSQEDQQSL